MLCNQVSASIPIVSEGQALNIGRSISIKKLKGNNLILVTSLLFPHFGGVCSYLFEEVSFLAKRGYNVYLIYSYLEHPEKVVSLGKAPEHKNFHMFGLPGYDRNVRVLIDRVRRIFFIKGLSRRIKVSCFHAHDYYSALNCVLAGQGKKTILHLHGIVSEEDLKLVPFHLLSAGSIVKKLVRYFVNVVLEVLTFNLVRGIICVSEYPWHDALRKSLVRNKIMILRNGVDVGIFRRKPKKRDRLRRAMNISDDVVVCMYFGRMAASHGPLLLSKAIPTVNEKTGGVIFLFVGEGVQKERIVEDVRDQRLSNVFFPSVTRPEDIYSASDIFLDNLSNIVKGHGISILEAMASGVPVITGRDEIKEKAFVEGEEILFAEKDDPKDIAEKIVSLVFDSKKREELSLRGRKRVVADFSVEKHMQILEKILLSE